jgi:hypothetical protein
MLIFHLVRWDVLLFSESAAAVLLAMWLWTSVE